MGKDFDLQADGPVSGNGDSGSSPSREPVAATVRCLNTQCRVQWFEPFARGYAKDTCPACYGTTP